MINMNSVIFDELNMFIKAAKKGTLLDESHVRHQLCRKFATTTGLFARSLGKDFSVTSFAT